MKKLWEIMVPCEMGGKPVRRRHHQQWDREVRKYSGGLTLAAVAKGQWRNPSTQELIEERVIPVRFIATDKEMTDIGNFTLNHYRQKVVLVYELSRNVHFFETDKNT